MATYYIDEEAGDDSRTALQAQSPSTPFKRPRGMDGVAGTSATTGAAGDIFILKGGVTWAKQLSAPVAGATYRSNTGYGTGRAIIDVPTSETKNMAVYVNNTNSVTLDGLELIHRRTTNDYACSVYVSGTSTGFVMDDCHVHSSPSGLHLLVGTSGHRIRNSHFYDNTFEITQTGRNASGIRIAGATDIKVTGCSLYRNGATTVDLSGVNEGRGITIEGSGATQSDGVDVANCLFWDNGDVVNFEEGSAIEGANSINVNIVACQVLRGATAVEVKRSCEGWRFYGNLFIGSSSGVFQLGFYSTDSPNNEVVNNTIISDTNLLNAALKLSSPTNKVMNNIVCIPAASDRACIFLDTSGTDWNLNTLDNIFDRNITYGGTYPIITRVSGSYTNYTNATWTAAHASQAVNSQHINPQLDSAYHLGAGSPARSIAQWFAGVRAGDDLPLPLHPDAGWWQDRTAAGRRFGSGGGTL